MATLAEILEENFRGDIRFRGAAYIEAERIAITHVTADSLHAVVRDGVEYQTQLTRDNEKLRLSCSCSNGSVREPSCKHLWATILATDAGSYLTASPRPGYMPPFATAVDDFDLDDFEDEWDDGLSASAYKPSVGKTLAQRRRQAEPPMREWEAKLHKLRTEMDAGGATGNSQLHERDIFYEIDVHKSQLSHQLIIQVSQRQRRSNGQWGKLKPLKLKQGQLDEIAHADDRRILAYLSGGTAERSNWYAQQTEFQSAIHRFRVPYELCELVLPMMCATQRVRYLNSPEQGWTPLKWDEGPAWELSLHVLQNDDTKNWSIKGILRRGEETISVPETDLIVPGGLMLADSTIAQVGDFGSYDWIDMLLRNDAVSVPDGEEQEFVDSLLDLPSVPRLELPESLKLKELHPTPTPHLVIHSPGPARWQREQLRGEVYFEYLGRQIRGSSTQQAIVQRGEGLCIIRDRKLEEQFWSQLQAHGFRRLLDHRRGNYDIEITARDLGPAVRAIINDGWQIRAEGKQVRQPGEMQFRVKSQIDWFELHGEVSFEGQSVAFPELLSALSRGDSTVRLDDGSLGILPEEWIQQYGMLAGLGVAEDDHLRFEANQVAFLDALLAAQTSVDYDQKFADMRDKLNSFSGIGATHELKQFQGELRPYQREGLGWLNFLQEFKFGGCLADDMGLGKTVQMLALLQARANDDKRKELPPSLIVVPKSLLFNWFQEIERFTPELKALEYSGLDRAALRSEFPKYNVILTTYGTVRRDVILLKDIRFDYVVLDEAQTIKNAGSQVAKASRLLNANHRLALSGTPIENHLGDLWSIFEFLNPGMLGRSSVFKLYAGASDDPETRKLLAHGLKPFILRRTKKQVASDLPEKLEETIYCKMGEKQERLYLELRDHYRDSILGLVRKQGLAKSKMHVLEALLRLRQAACHPALLNKESGDESSAKLDVLCPHLEELIDEGHKTLVFSQFTSMLAIVKKHLDKRGIVYEYLDGKTRNRKAAVERFQTDEDCRVFLISLKAGGLGLNLTAADYVFLLDPWWNPAVETQAIDRAHRVGQTKQVFAYRLICRDTVEEKIAELQKKKRNLADAILQESNSVLKELSTDDLEMLLS